MSMNALICGTIKHLRTVLDGADERICDEAADDDGRPPPFAGQWYYAIHEGEWRNKSDLSLDDRLGIMVTITRRTGEFTWDRLKQARFELRERAEQIRVAIHVNDTLRGLANALIPGTVNGFVEPLMFVSGGTIQTRYASWFGASGPDSSPLGLSRTLVFADALRIQTLESMT